MSAPPRCLVFDGEPFACERLTLLLAEAGGAEVVGEVVNGRGAPEQISELRPDVKLLDIEMPGLGRFDVVDLLDLVDRPAVVSVTAFDAYAVRTFGAHAIGYLTKTVCASRPETLCLWSPWRSRQRENPQPRQRLNFV